MSPGGIQNKTRRVVVTGLGLVTPLGLNVSTTWSRLLAGASGITSLKGKIPVNTADKKSPFPSHVSYEALPCKVGGWIPKVGETDLNSSTLLFDPSTVTTKDNVKKMSLFMLYTFAAAKEAMQDASFPESYFSSAASTRNTTQVCATPIGGVSIATGIGSVDTTGSAYASFLAHGFRKTNVYLIPTLLPNTIAGLLSREYGFIGPSHCLSTACAASAHAVGEAARMIRDGDADVMLSGGGEACLSPFGLSGFAKARSLSTRYNDTPEQASRPFDKDRDGFVMSEGAGMLVLEDYEHAKRRNARIYAELVGYGTSCDAYHVTSPHPDGLGARRAMQRALKTSKMHASEVGYINAHATSTLMGDEVEARAIADLFPSQSTIVSSTKGSTGHLLGASGSIESIFTILSVYHNAIPLSLNCRDSSEMADINIAKQTIYGPVNAALSNSFGFGGTNASLLFSKI